MGLVRLTWYSNIDPTKTVEITNYMKTRTEAGDTIFYDIYTDKEKATDPAKKDTGLFFFKGKPGERFAICNAGGGFAYVGAMHDSFPHALELSKMGYNAFALIYRPGAQTACEDLARAIDFIFEHAEELEVDTDRYSLWGGSAGARMAAYLGSYGPAGFGGGDLPRPGAVNFGYNVFDNMDEFAAPEDDAFVPGAPVHFVDYVEGIYVGYKYYETAAEEGFIDYDQLVQYPFGHGLSYTTFSQEMGTISESNGAISFDVTVTNTGSVAGKDVVQVYYNPPYTNGGIEKASANLIAFDKTDLLQPGDSQKLTISFDVEDMASYDMGGNGRYVLESGEYTISINSDFHSIIDSQTYTVSSDIDYSAGRSTDLAAPANLFDFADGGLTYLSRADGFANFAQATAAPSATLRAEDKALFANNSNYQIPTDTGAVMPATGANNGMKAVELRGAAYDDQRWDTLLDNLTLDEMNNMIALGGYQTAPAASIDKIQTIDCDGPAALNNNFTQVGSVGFPSSVMIACTWNEDLARAFGEGIAAMADDMDVSGWYAPAMNIHRTPFAGRNFEYYSEDGFLFGRIASQATQGASDNGVYPYIKHFALNDQETGRWEMLTTWSTEQAMREIYLKPFEICVKDNRDQGGASNGHPLAVMSSYNYIGTQWAGACPNLLNNVLRGEWGFQGAVLTDYFANFGYMDATRSIHNGGDSCLINRDMTTNNVTDTSNPLTVQQMRRACKNILYVAVNSRGYAPENLSVGGLMSWQIILIVVDVILAAAIIALEVVIFRTYKKKAAAK